MVDKFLLHLELFSLFPEFKARRCWTLVAETALSVLDLKTARRIYQQILSDAGMVITLNRLGAIEDRNELLGHVAVIFGDFDLAQVSLMTLMMIYSLAIFPC